MKLTLGGGYLIVFEGIDGSGKSTQAKILARELMNRGYDVVLTGEPTNGHWGKLLRKSATTGRMSPKDELNAFLQDRKEHVENLIRPSLEAGKIVITDRYYFSTVAYQGLRGLDPQDLLRQNEAIAIEPNLLFLIDIDPVTSQSRIANRDGKTDLFEKVDLLAKARDLFLAIEKEYLVIMDGSKSVEEIKGNILAEVDRRIKFI